MEHNHIHLYNIQGGIKKAQIGFRRMIILGIFAGIFIAVGAETSSIAAHNITDVGTARLITGLIFPVGLMMTVLTGSELFTGNCMMSMALADRKITLIQMLRNLVIVFFSNMIGTLIVVLLVFFSCQYDYSDGGLGAYTIKIAMDKTGLEFSEALFSGILCNILVCIAVLVAGAAKDVVGKVMAVFFPIMAFVVSGMEHSIANMYYIPAGLFAATDSRYIDKACELYGYTSEQIRSQLTVGHYFTDNLIPVTIGNIIGGAVIVGLGFYAVVTLEGKEKREAEENK